MSKYRFTLIIYGDEALFNDQASELAQQSFDSSRVQVLFGQSSINDAIAKAEGEYTVFLNAADIFENDALESADKYFSEAGSCKIMASKLTGKKVDGKKYRRYRVEETTVVKANLDDKNNKTLKTTDGVFYDTNLVKEIMFNEELSGEEQQIMFFVEAFDKCGEYARNSGCILHLADGEKEIQLQATPEFFKALTKLGRSKYVQNITLTAAIVNLDKPERLDEMNSVITALDDEVINNVNDLSPAQIKYFLQLKHKDQRIDSSFFDLKNIHSVVVTFFDLNNGRVKIEGVTYTNIFDNISIFIETSRGDRYPVELKSYPALDEYCYQTEKIYDGTLYEVEFEAPIGGWFRFVLVDDKGNDTVIRAAIGGFAKIHNSFPMSYCHDSKCIITLKGTKYSVKPYTRINHIKHELKAAKWLISKKEYIAALYRLLRPLYKERKPIWLMEDRPQAAKDNAEHMFRFMNSDPEIKGKYSVYFVLNKDSADFERMKKYGKVLEYDSFKHKMKFLNADKIIAANANKTSINIFGRSKKYYGDLYKFGFVYLRHGISHNDQSAWLHRTKKNIYILCSTTRREYESILNGNYGYDESTVKLTGLARYDNLKDFSSKKITIMPTWRRNIEAPLEPRSCKRQYNNSFKQTEYFNFYNSLINDERLIEAMRSYGYTGSFYVHPVFEEQAKDFKGNDCIKAYTELADYQQVFGESSIMVTDYSSVAFDFAYLKKPIIYSQFDRDDFYNVHTWGKGYFSYADDGFGDITETVDSTVDKLIYYMENECKMESKYLERVDSFYSYTDRNNCRRIYNAIVEKEQAASL